MRSKWLAALVLLTACEEVPRMYSTRAAPGTR